MSLITNEERQKWTAGKTDAQKLVIAFERACLTVAQPTSTENNVLEYGSLRGRIERALEAV